MSFTNLLFLKTAISIVDGYGRLDVTTVGSGEGWFCTGGQVGRDNMGARR